MGVSGLRTNSNNPTLKGGEQNSTGKRIDALSSTSSLPRDHMPLQGFPGPIQVMADHSQCFQVVTGHYQVLTSQAVTGH